MNDLRKADAGDARASDRDRQKVSEELRVHWADGRIDVEELERRVELAMAARTIRELAEAVSDLPNVRVPDPIENATDNVRLGPPGIRPFTRRVEVPASIDRVRRMILDTVAAGLNGSGYELIYQDPTTLTFERSVKERLSIDLEARGHDNTTMIIYGRASRRIRKHFIRLHFGR